MSPPTDLSKHGREFVSASAALELVGSGARVFVHTGAAAPRVLIEALAERARTIDGIEVTHLHTEGPAPYIGGESPSRRSSCALRRGERARRRQFWSGRLCARVSERDFSDVPHRRTQC